jgi:uncharacterized protein YqhQ
MNPGPFLARGFHRLNWTLAFLSNYQPESIGGQAVIEGVLMRSPRRLAVAVRAPDGEIVIENKEFLAFSRRWKILGLPVLRGAASLIESLSIGIKALNFSMAVQERMESRERPSARREPVPGPDPAQGHSSAGERITAAAATVAAGSVGLLPGEAPARPSFDGPASGTPAKRRLVDSLLVGASLLTSLALALALFQLLPYWVASTAVGGTVENPAHPVAFNFTAGIVRISLLLLYMWGISHLKDIRRVFQYHGAEHKSIFAHERHGGLTVEGARAQSRFHPRCGTSFILIVALVCILFFSVLDGFLWQAFGYTYPTFFHRFLIHLPFVPVVAGLSFEVLKWTARFQDSAWVRPLVLPGLWLQNITTREPDEKQLEVAIASIEAALAK